MELHYQEDCPQQIPIDSMRSVSNPSSPVNRTCSTPPCLLNNMILRHIANCSPITAKIIPRNPAPRPNLIDSRQTAKKSASGKEATEEKVPRSVKIEQLNASLLDRPDFRDKVVPMRTFRRIRPWAGDRVRKADINRYDLYQLPIFPSAERAFVPWIDTRAPLVSSSPNGATAAPNWVAPNGSTTTPVPGGVRRNPRRRARNN